MAANNPARTLTIGQPRAYSGVNCRVTDDMESNSDVRTLRASGQTVRVIQGIAWVTLDGADIILHPGDNVYLRPGASPATISRLGSEMLVYEIVWACGR